MPSIDSRQIARAVLLALHWCLLTVAVGAVVVHSAPSLEGMVTPTIEGSYLFVAAFVASVLLGLTLTSPKVALPLSLLMCLVAASFFAAIMYAPARAGVTVWTQALENFVTTRVLFYLFLMFLPAMIGAFLGTAFGGMLSERHDLLHDQPDETAQVDRPWWERRQHTS